MFAKKALAAAVSAGPKVYVEDVFSTYLYTGNSSTQTINNEIDLAGEGGLVWVKDRTAANGHILSDTNRGAGYWLTTIATNAQTNANNYISAFNSNGFTVNYAGSGANATNLSGDRYVSWTFRKAEKFFDVVTYTGNSSTQTISHNLGTTPGFVIIKCTSSATNWVVWHRELSYGYILNLNLSNGQSGPFSNVFGNNSSVISPEESSTTVTIGNSVLVNQSGQTYIMYVFAHNAGGFGENSDQHVISCGGYTGNGSATGPTINLGYEPQWLLIKNRSDGSPWYILDNMRGIFTGTNDPYLQPNTASAESGDGAFDVCQVNATGFQISNSGAYTNANGNQYIYVAIRRGPMKTPEAGTEVYAAAYGLSTSPVFISGFPVDFFMEKAPALVGDWYQGSRLTGYQYMSSNNTNAEATGSAVRFDYMNGSISAFSGSTDYVGWNFRRAPGFFDVVCYTGTGSARTVSHNLGVEPEMIWVKARSVAGEWWNVYTPNNKGAGILILNQTSAYAGSTAYWNNTNATSSVFTVGATNEVGGSGVNYIAYLFASCPGVSKLGSYTGTGTTLQVNCGFTTGARFVLIKRTDSTGNWYVWDSTRGIVSGSDPFLLLNVSNAEITGTDYIDTYSAGFEITSAAPAEINANGGTFIFLAIA